jgi:hypothetical protein
VFPGGNVSKSAIWIVHGERRDFAESGRSHLKDQCRDAPPDPAYKTSTNKNKNVPTTTIVRSQGLPAIEVLDCGEVEANEQKVP